MSSDRREFLAAVEELFGAEVAHVTAVQLEKKPIQTPAAVASPLGDETTP